MRFSFKIGIVLLFCLISALAAVRLTDRYVLSVSEKEKSMAEAMLENQLKQAMKDAEDVARAELEEQNITIATTVLETKPPITTAAKVTSAPETSPPETTVTETTVTETVAPQIPESTAGPVQEETTTTVQQAETQTETSVSERITDFRRGGLLDEAKSRPLSEIKIRTVLTLSSEEQEIFTNYMVEHYYLDGYAYVEREQDPALKKKKKTAADMQAVIQDSLDLVTGSLNISSPADILSADYTSIIIEAENLKEKFISDFADASGLNLQFESIYTAGIAYFDRLIQALSEFKKTSDDYKNAPNPLLAIGLVASSIDNVLFPEITAVIESSFDIMEVTQEIFLEGTQGAWLLTREEMIDIIANPGLIL